MMDHWSRTAMATHAGDSDALALACWLSVQALDSSLPDFEHVRVLQIADRACAIPIHQVGRFTQSARIQKLYRRQAKRHHNEAKMIRRRQAKRRSDATATLLPRVLLAGDYLATATVEGALRTGMWAAEAMYNGR
jgi:hypothetical protein